MKKLVYTVMGVVGLYIGVPANGFAQQPQKNVTAYADTAMQKAHLMDEVEVTSTRKLVSNNV